MQTPDEDEVHLWYEVVANVTDTPDAHGLPGSKHFSPGTKVIVFDIKWASDRRWNAWVIGLHRSKGQKRRVNIWVDFSRLTNIRVSLEYHSDLGLYYPSEDKHHASCLKKADEWNAVLHRLSED